MQVIRFIKKLAVAMLIPFCIGTDANAGTETQEPLLVSLGSTCEVPFMLRIIEVRKTAFPFDWVNSIDGEKLIEILEDGFKYFFDDRFYTINEYGWLIHNYYSFKFPHDGDFKSNYPGSIRTFYEKYSRRIERFLSLNSYQGKVFFFRNSYFDPAPQFSAYYEIFDEYSIRLYNALKKRFPELSFTLVIMNPHNRNEIEFENKISENIVKVRANPKLQAEIKKLYYAEFWKKLIEENP